MTDFSQIREVMNSARATYSCFVPDDIESLYEEWRSENPDWPEWADVADDMLESYHWTEAMGDRMTEAGWDVIGDMISDIMGARMKS